jgi:hypothetical protein
MSNIIDEMERQELIEKFNPEWEDLFKILTD